MGRTVLELVQSACYESNIDAPSALVGATAASTLQLLTLFYATGRHLRTLRHWSQLKRQHYVLLEPGRSQYPLPADFFAPLPQTTWDYENTAVAHGPMSDPEFINASQGIVNAVNRTSFRVFGGDINQVSGRGQLQVTPTPGEDDANTFLTYEYVSKSWLIPPLWTASESVAQNTWRFSAGNIYKKTDANSEAGSTIPPNMSQGIGQDGGVFWLYFAPTAWGTSTAYRAGAYVTNDSGKVYVATQSGTSGVGAGPTGTDADQEEGTVIWDYVSVATWAAYTAYEEGDHVINGANRYRCVRGPFYPSGLKSGSAGPDWTATTVPDGAITYTIQTAAYETAVTDSDLCLFDDELMIAGLKWRFCRARGLEFKSYKEDYDEMAGDSFNRMRAGTRFSVINCGGERGEPIANLPEGDWDLD